MQSWRGVSWNQGSRTTEPRQNPGGYNSASGASWAPDNQVDRGILIEISRAGMDSGSITVTQTSSLIQLDAILEISKVKEVKVAQSCPTLLSMDCSLPSSSVHGVFQARILEWVAISFSRGSS